MRREQIICTLSDLVPILGSWNYNAYELSRSAMNQVIKKHALSILCAAILSIFSLGKLEAALRADLVAEADTGRIIYGDNIYSLRHPASLTKIMTLYMVFAALDQGRLGINDRMGVSEYASTMPPSKLGLKPGERIRVRDAILALVTQSANDVSVVIGEAIGGTEWRFAEMMTQQARALGMKRTIFRNASGLHDEEQVTTAFDQAILARAMLYHFPRYYGYFKTRAYTWDGATHRNHNRLMTRYDGMDGIKTGFIRQSGFNLVASARRYGKRLIGVVMGGQTARSRDNHMADLLDDGFNRVVAESRGGKRYAQAPIPADDEDNYPRPRPASTQVSQGDDESEDEPTDVLPPRTKASTLIKETRAALQKTKKNVNGWAIQVGAYDSKPKGSSAITAAKRKAPSLLKNAKSVILTAKNGKKTIYRARLSGLSEQAARSSCSRLGNSCNVLPPRAL